MFWIAILVIGFAFALIKLGALSVWVTLSLTVVRLGGLVLVAILLALVLRWSFNAWQKKRLVRRTGETV